MNLLMIDDDILDLEWISAMIAKMPFSFEKTFLASNVKHAKEIFGKYRIDIALVDIEMPGGESGLDLTKWIVGEKYETIVIFVTSHGRFDYATEALRLQARDYLLKPVSDDALYESLQRAVSFLQMNKPEIDFMDESSVVNKIKRYIKDHVQERISRENLADIVYLHPDYISRIFKEETGTTLDNM